MYPGALPYVLALLAVASLTLGIAVYAFRRAGQPGALIFGLCTAAMGEWAAFYALELFAPDLPNKLWAAKMEYLGIAAVPPLWLAFAVQYTGRVRWLTRGTRLLLVVPAAVTFALALTNEWHHLIWSGVRLDPGGAPALYVLGHGAWFWVHVSISYAFVLAGFVLYVRAFARAARPYRHQMILMMLGAVAPLAGNAVFLTGLFPLPWLDLTPFAFMASGVLLALGFFRFDLLDLTPIAAAVVVEQLRDAVIAVDLQNRIIELNTTAQRWLGVGPEVLGANAFEVLQLDEAARQYAEATDVHTEVEIGTGAARRCFDLTISPLRSARGRMVGRVAVMRNITNERALLQAERRLARQMEALNRLTRLTLQTTDFQGLLQMLADQLGDLFGADGAFITLWDEAQQETVPAAAFGNLRGRNPAIRARPGETTPTESALHAGHQLAIEDVNNTPYLSPRIAAIFPSRSLLALPLIADGQKLGAALIAFEQTHLFTPDELALGEQVTGQISLAIARARLFEELERRAAEAETLRQASAVVVSTLRQEEAIKRILVQLERVVPYDSAAVLLLVSDDEGQQFLEIVGGRGWPDPSVVQGIRFPVPGDNPNTIVIQERRPHILDDAPAVHAPFREDPHSHIRSWLGVPLLVGERTIGMLAVDSIQPHHFTAHHAQLVTAYADQVAIAVRNAQLYQAEEQGRRALAALVEVLQVAGSSLEFKQVLKEIARRTALICSANRCSIFLLDESEERLQPVMSQFADGHVDAEMWEVFRTTTADRVDAVPLFQMAVRERRPAQLDDPARYDLLPRHWTEPFGIQRLLVVPLQYKERVLGALALDQIHIGHMFTQEQVDLAQAVGTQVSSAIVNARLHAKTRARAAEQAALLKISTAISAHLDMEQLLTEMARQTMHALNGTSCYFSFWEPEHQVLRVATEYFGPDANADERVSDLGAAYPLKGNDREYLQSDQPRVKHVSQPKEDPVYAAHLLAYGGKTVLGVPLRVGGELLGELELWDSRTERDFNADELRLVQTIASQAALALQNARLYEAQRTQLRLARTLQEVGALLTAELSLEKVLNRLFDLLARVVTYDSVSVFLLQDDDRMEPVAARGGGDVEQIRHSMREVHRPESQRGFWPTDRALIVADTRDHSHWHFYPGTEQVRSWVGAPLLVRGESIGVLNVNSHTPNAYAPQTSELVMAFANQAAVAIQNARLSDRLLELARVDSLTGLINRRRLFEIAEQEFQRARRYKRPLAVIMFDLDHFKRVNDTHGHAVGDEVLQAVAQRCRQNLREIDKLGRYGGEEFLVVMPEVELAHARQAAERLRSCVAGAPLETEIGPVALTISLGVAVLTAAHADLPPLVKAADAALYAAKEGGRNRVVVAGEGSTPEW